MAPPFCRVTVDLLACTGRPRFAVQTTVLLTELAYHMEKVKALS
jgi:hypothetical protein